MHDYLIVGQGIAGTMLAHFLRQKNKKLLIVDQKHHQAASAVAAGIVNPITGRHFIKSWRVDELIPFAFQTYQTLEKTLGTPLLEFKNIARIFDRINTVNNWAMRSSSPDVKAYVHPHFEPTFYRQFLQEVEDGVEFKQSGRILLKKVIESYKKLLQQEESYLEEKFEHEYLEISTDFIAYKGHRASKIIFAEGYQVIHNPYFNYLPFLPAKGDILMVRIPNYPAKDKLIKHGVFIIPWQNDVFWVGSTYTKNYLTENPVEAEGLALEERLRRILKLDFEVLEHITGIRPTVRDRQPFTGQHPVFDRLYLFNGMGAKGSYLSPFFAHHFADYLENIHALDPSIDIKRYFKYYPSKPS